MKIRPSTQEMLTRITSPMMMVSRLTTRSTSPKEIQRRMRLRSVIARDSNCPLGQRSWKLTGRSWRCAYSTLRILASMWVPGLSTNQRRAIISTASRIPSASTTQNAGQIWETSPVCNGPSTRARNTCGIANATRAASSAATIPP